MKRTFLKAVNAIPIFSAIVLSLVISIPFYLARFGNLSVGDASRMYSLGLEILFLPLPGIVASLYGFFVKYGQPARLPAWAFIIGLAPYIPLIFVGIPPILGVAMGLMGAGSAFARRRNLHGLLGFVLFSMGIVIWVLIRGGLS